MSDFSLNVDTIELASTDTADIIETEPPVDVTVMALLVSYPSKIDQKSFTVQVYDPCETTLLNFNPPVINMQITAGDEPVNLTIKATDSISFELGT